MWRLCFVILFPLTLLSGLQIGVDPFGLFWKRPVQRDSPSPSSLYAFRFFDSLALFVDLRSRDSTEIDYVIVGDSRLDPVRLADDGCRRKGFSATIGGASYKELGFLLGEARRKWPRAVILLSIDQLNFFSERNRFSTIESLISRWDSYGLLLNPKHLVTSLATLLDIGESEIRGKDHLSYPLERDRVYLESLPEFGHVKGDFESEFASYFQSYDSVWVYVPRVHPAIMSEKNIFFRTKLVELLSEMSAKVIDLDGEYLSEHYWYDSFHLDPTLNLIDASIKSSNLWERICE